MENGQVSSNFSDGQKFRLRPLFLAYEDRQQITELFIEILNRFSIAATVFYGFKVSPSDLWQKMDPNGRDRCRDKKLSNRKFNCIRTTLHISQCIYFVKSTQLKLWIDQILMFSPR